MLAQWIPCWQEFCVSHSSSIFLRNGNLILNFSLNVHIDIFSFLQPKMVLAKWKKVIVHLLHTVNNIYCARVLRLLSIYSMARLLSLFPIYIHLTYIFEQLAGQGLGHNKTGWYIKCLARSTETYDSPLLSEPEVLASYVTEHFHFSSDCAPVWPWRESVHHRSAAIVIFLFGYF